MAKTDLPRDETCHLSTRFEDWCDLMGVHPETFGAWEHYEATVLRATPEAAYTGVA